MERKFVSSRGDRNGRIVTVNGAFSVCWSGQDDLQVWVTGPKGADRHGLVLNWSDALMLAMDIIKAVPDDVTGAYRKVGV